MVRGRGVAVAVVGVLVVGACGGGGGPAPASPSTVATAGAARDLGDPALQDLAMQLVSSAENSSLDWRTQYRYVEDIGDGRGYTAGIIGFTSATGDLLDVVERYASDRPEDPLAAFLPALRKVQGTPSHAGLGRRFEAAWRAASDRPAFRAAQDAVRDADYLDPAVERGRADGLGALGQLVYFDALVMHGPGDDATSFGGIRRAALGHARTPADGGDETAYLEAFLDARVVQMRAEEAHEDTSRVDTAQRVFLREGNLDLHLPLVWHVYGDRYAVGAPDPATR